MGRTARGNNKGTALSLVARKEMERAAATEAQLKERQGISGLDGGDIFKPYQFRMEELDGFRYRARDAWRSVTKIAVREARLKEIRQELLNSVKLQSHFSENPNDATVLRHDKALHTVKRQAHLKHVPEYIVPKSLKKISGASGTNSASTSVDHGATKRKRNFRGGSAAKRKFEKKMNDPLQM